MIDRWALAALTVLGVWLVAAPGLLDLHDGARVSHLTSGPIVAAVSIVAQSSVVRGVSRAAAAIGTWLVLAPLLIDHGPWWFESILVGFAIVIVSFVPRPDSERYGGGWASLIADSRASRGETRQGKEAGR